MVTLALISWFWDVFWLLIIFIPLTVLWIFSVVDVFRRDDLSGVARAVWLIVVFVFPLFGTLAYVIVRPNRATFNSESLHTRGAGRVDQLQALGALHDSGKLTEAEFMAEKQRVLTNNRDDAIRFMATGGV